MHSVKYCDEYASIEDRKTYHGQATVNDGDNRREKPVKQRGENLAKRTVAMYCLLVVATTAGFAAIFVISFEFQGTGRREYVRLENKFTDLEKEFRQLKEKSYYESGKVVSTAQQLNDSKSNYEEYVRLEDKFLGLEKEFRQLEEKNYNESGKAVSTVQQLNDSKPNYERPRLYYYSSTLTWQSSRTFCERLDRTLCTFDQICPQNNAGRRYIDDVIPGDHWVAVLEGRNDWVEIGDVHVTQCVLHRPPRWSSLPTWGESSVSRSYKGYVYCCEVSAATERVAPQIRYQYIGEAATYNMSAQHCEQQGRKLCYSSDVCKASRPVLGMVRGNKWIAVRDRHNEWIQIGNAAGSTCKTQGVLHGLPSWGVRTDGSLLDHVGYVYCCRSSDGR